MTLARNRVPVLSTAHLLVLKSHCVALEPKWAKGHTRKAASLHGLKRYLGAVQAYEEALVYEPGAEALLLGRRQSSFSLAIEPE